MLVDIVVNIVMMGLFAFIFVGFVVVFICRTIDDKRFKYKLQTKRRIEQTLISRLHDFCYKHGIPVNYYDDLGDAAGTMCYHSNGLGMLIVDNAEIRIREKYKDDPYVLAHEVGHYIAIKNYQDATEKSADREARKLCESYLTKREQETMREIFDIYFN